MKRAIVYVALALGLFIALPVGVAAQSAPDLHALGLGSRDNVKPGETFRLLVTVQNIGHGQAAATTVRFYRSTDSTITTSDTELGTESIPSLGYLQGRGSLIPTTAPATAGTYYYGACVDTVAGELDLTNNCSGAREVTVQDVDEGTESSGGGGSSSTSRQSAIVGNSGAATATELQGDKLRIDIHDQPDNSFELGIGWVSRDGSSVVLVGVIRDQPLGQTYLIVRHEGHPQIVRRWVPPYSPLIYAIDWPLVIANNSYPVAIITAIPLDHRHPELNMLARRFDGRDDRIFAYDAALQQWRHIPDWPTFQAMGFYWCDVTAADAGFFDRISIGPPYPSSGTPVQSDYPNCSTG